MGAHPSAPTTPRLATIARTQIRRDPWPDFESFEATRYDGEVRRSAAIQWWRRAREEYGSIHEFTGLSKVLCELRAPIELLAAASRLITDEARHAELCSAMARALLPVLRGRPKAWMEEGGYDSGAAGAITLDIKSPVVLDGEIFQPEPGLPVRLTGDRTQTFITGGRFA